MNKIILLAYLAVFNFVYSQESNVDKAINDFIQKNKIVGLQIAVVKDQQIIKTSHYGLANIQDSIKVDAQTVFSINSMTKAFTGVAIMQLVEKGQLDFQDKISKYLSPLPETWQNITVEQIITHQSGLPGIWDSQGNMLSEDATILLQKMEKLPLAFKPGEQVRDDVTNYLILGMLIEKISGLSYERFIIEKQFKRAGMKNSIKAGMGDFSSIINHSARPYSNFNSGVLSNVYQPMPSNLYSAGGIYSTASEMANWIIALQNHKLINRKSLELICTPIVLNGKEYETTGPLNRSSISFFTTSKTEKLMLASLGGNRNALYMYPKNKVSVVILTNLVGSHPEHLIEEIANMYITGKE